MSNATKIDPEVNRIRVRDYKRRKVQREFNTIRVNIKKILSEDTDLETKSNQLAEIVAKYSRKNFQIN